MPASRQHPIPRRDLRFDFSKVKLDRWHPRGAQVSHYFNVQSLLFPQGERFFIRSVRYFRDQVRDPVLQGQVAGFIAQEAMHGREHDAYNAALKGIGYRTGAMDAWLRGMLWLAEKASPPKGRLAMTAALEHLTAIGAENLLDDERVLAGADPEMARLWRWHAVEETEHKAVAFDVYREVAGDGLISWLRRCWVMLLVSTSMTLMTWVALIAVSLRDGSFFRLSGWGSLLWMLWVSPGGLRREFPRYWQFFRPGFHPWQKDNYHHVQRWLASPSAAQAPLASSGALPGGA